MARSADSDQPVGERRAVGEGDAALPADDRVPVAGGHTAHETHDEAQAETMMILDVYADTSERVLAMPVVKGQKSEREVRRRAADLLDRGADGRRASAAGRHVAQPGAELRQGLDITFQARDKTCSTCGARRGRVDPLVGGVIMTHGDDSGSCCRRSRRPVSSGHRADRRDNWRETVLPARRDPAGAGAAGIRVTLDEREERPAGSSPNGSCAACRCAWSSGRRTSRSPRCRSRGGIRVRSRACRWTASPAGSRSVVEIEEPLRTRPAVSRRAHPTRGDLRRVPQVLKAAPDS